MHGCAKERNRNSMEQLCIQPRGLLVDAISAHTSIQHRKMKLLQYRPLIRLLCHYCGMAVRQKLPCILLSNGWKDRRSPDIPVDSIKR